MTESRSAKHPGRIVKRELDARGWKQRDLAEKMGRPEQTINELVSGKLGISIRMARELGAAFGTSAILWARLDAHYRLHRSHHEPVQQRP